MNYLKALLAVALALLSVSATASALTKVNVLAVAEGGDGISAVLNVEARPGTGKTFTEVTTKTGFSTQESEKTARRYAERYLDRNLDDLDVFFSVDTEAGQIDGPSAGGAMAVALIYELKGWSLPSYMALTGTISDSGVIGGVGGIFAKVKAASDLGFKLVIIPAGQKDQTGSVEDGGRTVVKEVDLVEYAPANWGVIVAEAGTVTDAINIIQAPLDANAIKRVEKEELPSFTPSPLTIPKNLEPFKAFAEKIVENSLRTTKEAEDALRSGSVSDSDVIAVVTESISEAKTSAEEARGFLEKNYLYTGANAAFIAMNSARISKALLESPSLQNPESTAFKNYLEEQSKRCERLKADANTPLTLKGADWTVGGQHRLLWACRNVEKLQAVPEGSDEEYPGKRLRDLVYAEGWMDSTEEMLSTAESLNGASLDQGKLVELAREELIKVEDLLTAKGCGLDDYDENCELGSKDLFERNYECAKESLELGWNLASIYCSSVAAGALESDSLQSTLSKGEADLSKATDAISAQVDGLQSRAEGSKTFFSAMFWQHSKYYSDKGKFNFENGDSTEAGNDLSSAVLLLQVASNLESSSREALGVEGVSAPSEEVSASVQVITTTEIPPLGFALLFILFAAALLTLAVITRHREGGKERSEERRKAREARRDSSTPVEKKPEYGERLKALTYRKALEKARNDFRLGRLNRSKYDALRLKYEKKMKE